MLIQLAVIAAVGYILGSIPTGQLVASFFKVDLTTRGSGKTGTTNVLRTLGPVAAAVVLAGDLAKGVIAVLFARWYVGLADWMPTAEIVAGFAAVLGHNWPVLNKFKGGRGVAVSGAVFIFLCPPAGLITLVLTLAILYVGQTVSLASLIGALIGLLVLGFFVVFAHYPAAYLTYGVLACALIWLRHVDNIQRILAGTERKLGQKA